MSIELQDGIGNGGNGGGGSLKFPTIVTSSGSSLPSASGYQVGDTFFNTTDKKIYKAGAGYVKNTDAKYNITIDIDFNTGVGSGFADGKYCQYQRGNVWVGNREYITKFKYLVDEITPIIMFRGYALNDEMSFVIKDKKLYYVYYRNTITSNQILSTPIELNKDYILKISRVSESRVCTVQLYVGDTKIEEISFETPFETTNTYDYYSYGTGKFDSTLQDYYGNSLYVYLAESSGDFVVYDSTLNWDNGIDLTDKTEVADKTNGALYLYENSELVKIGGNLTKKVYTISADNTSTLNVSSDFTKVVDVLKNGVELAITDDYTISNGVITFVTALSTTDKITVKGV